MPAAKRYVWNLIALLAALLVLGGIANVLIDPYGIFRLLRVPGFNAVKPFQANMEQLFKPIALVRYDPEAVMLGSSTTQFGMDPRVFEKLSGARAYNFGIDGPTIWEVESFLRFALRNSHAGEAIVVLDLLMFNGARNRSNSRFNSRRMEARFSRLTPDYFSVRELFRVLFSSTALWDSLRTPFSQQSDPYYDERGYAAQTGGRSHMVSLGKLSLYFARADAAYSSAHGNPGANYFALPDGGSSLDAIDSILVLATDRGVRLRLVLAPLHVQFQGRLRDMGLCPALSSWRRTVRERVELHVARGTRVELYDYLQDPRNAEPVPAEPGKDMKYWIDSYHFSPSYGAEIIAAILKRDGAKSPGPRSPFVEPGHAPAPCPA